MRYTLKLVAYLIFISGGGISLLQANAAQRGFQAIIFA